MTEPNKWVPVLDSLIMQVYYRTLGTVSVHGPFEEVYQAAQHLQETKRGGVLKLDIPGRLATWDNVMIAPGIMIQGIRIASGIKFRNLNTVLVRRGWFTNYLVDVPDLGILVAKGQEETHRVELG